MTSTATIHPKLPAGVVTGDAYRTLVQACKDGGYALPAVNVAGTNSINAALEAAAIHKSDIILQLSSGGAQFYGGKGLEDTMHARILGAVSAAQHIHLMAEHYGVCVVLHTDHAHKELIPWVEALIDYSEDLHQAEGLPLFSSHMLDLSAESLEFNLSESKRLLERMDKLEMSLEIELGITGGEEDGIGSEDNLNNSSLYTQPEDCLRAYEDLRLVGHFSIAASFGNVHGVYKPGNVKLRPDILKQSQDLVQSTFETEKNPLNLVFHGGSGSSESEIKEAISYGVFKFNIDTDLQFAFSKGVGDHVMAHPKAFAHQVDPESGEPFKKQYDPRVYLRAGEKAMIDRLGEAFKVLGSAGKTLAESD